MYEAGKSIAKKLESLGIKPRASGLINFVNVYWFQKLLEAKIIKVTPMLARTVDVCCNIRGAGANPDI